MRWWNRVGAATGVGFVLCSAVAFLIVPDPPSADEGSEFVLNFFAENDSDVLWQAFFFGLGGVFLVFPSGRHLPKKTVALRDHVAEALRVQLKARGGGAGEG